MLEDKLYFKKDIIIGTVIREGITRNSTVINTTPNSYRLWKFAYLLKWTMSKSLKKNVDYKMSHNSSLIFTYDISHLYS